MTDYDEQSFKFLTENSADMIFRCDFAPKFTYVSPSSLRLLGKAPEEFVGLHPSSAVFADDPERAVTGPDQRDRGLDDLREHRLEVEVGPDGDDRVQEGVDPVPGGHHGLQPGLELAEQIIALVAAEQR